MSINVLAMLNLLDSATYQGDSVYLNVRSKCIDQGDNLYSALILGVGSLQAEATDLGVSESDTDISFQAGLEVGYMLNDIDFSLGYRFRMDNFYDEQVKIKGFTAGMRYNF